MELIEIHERFTEGLRKSIDRCKELEKHQKNRQWSLIANHLTGLLESGHKLAKKQLTTAQVEAMLAKREKDLGVGKQDG